MEKHGPLLWIAGMVGASVALILATAFLLIAEWLGATFTALETRIILTFGGSVMGLAAALWLRHASRRSRPAPPQGA